MKKDIKDIDATSTGSQIFGFIAGTLLNFLKIFAITGVANLVVGTGVVANGTAKAVKATKSAFSDLDDFDVDDDLFKED